MSFGIVVYGRFAVNQDVPKILHIRITYPLKSCGYVIFALKPKVVSDQPSHTNPKSGRKNKCTARAEEPRA